MEENQALISKRGGWKKTGLMDDVTRNVCLKGQDTPSVVIEMYFYFSRHMMLNSSWLLRLNIPGLDF